MKFDDLEPIQELTPPNEIAGLTGFQWIMIIAFIIIIISVVLFMVRMANSHSSLAKKLAPFEKAQKELLTLSGEQKDAHETAIDTSFILRQAIVQETGDKALFETHEEFSARPDSLHTLPVLCREPLRLYLQRLARMKYIPKNQGDNAQELIHEALGLIKKVEEEIKLEAQAKKNKR